MKNKRNYAISGLIVAAISPMTSHAITCPMPTHKTTTIGGTSLHACIKAKTGSVLVEVLTEEHPGVVKLNINPLNNVSGAYILCRNPGKKGKLPPGINPVAIPTTLSQLSNTVSTTYSRTSSPGLFTTVADTQIKYLTTLRITPTAQQLNQLKIYCPNENWTVADYVPGAFIGVMTFSNQSPGSAILPTFNLNTTGGDCSVPLSTLTVNASDATFNPILYGGGCGAAGDEIPWNSCEGIDDCDYHDRD